MRLISSPLQSRLDSGTTTLAQVWRIERTDGARFAFTDHDRALAFDDLTCAPQTGFAGGAIEKSLGLNVDTGSAAGALSADAITDADLSDGLWDGARVDIYKVDWTDPSLRVHIFSGHLGEARRGRDAFEIELRGRQAALNVAMGRVYSRFCDADVGDARCGVDLNTTAFRAVATISAALSARAFSVTGLSAFAENWFSRGRLVRADGRSFEIATHRAGTPAATLELVDNTDLTIGANVTLYAGCDKRAATCREKFTNIENFRGFPHMPGNDAMQAGPDAGRNDGGSRWR